VWLIRRSLPPPEALPAVHSTPAPARFARSMLFAAAHSVAPAKAPAAVPAPAEIQAQGKAPAGTAAPPAASCRGPCAPARAGKTPPPPKAHHRLPPLAAPPADTASPSAAAAVLALPCALHPPSLASSCVRIQNPQPASLVQTARSVPARDRLLLQSAVRPATMPGSANRQVSPAPPRAGR